MPKPLTASALVGLRPDDSAAPARLASLLHTVGKFRGLERRAGLHEFPILTREMVQADAGGLILGNVPRGLMRCVTTSGSSGVPVAFWIDRAASLSEWRYMTRQWARVGYRSSDWRVVLRGRDLPLGTWSQKSRWRRELRLSLAALTNESVHQYARIIDESGAFPSCTHTRPLLSGSLRYARRRTCGRHDFARCYSVARPVPRRCVIGSSPRSARRCSVGTVRLRRFCSAASAHDRRGITCLRTTDTPRSWMTTATKSKSRERLGGSSARDSSTPARPC
jgi:hypothetical protein